MPQIRQQRQGSDQAAALGVSSILERQFDGSSDRNGSSVVSGAAPSTGARNTDPTARTGEPVKASTGHEGRESKNVGGKTQSPGPDDPNVQDTNPNNRLAGPQDLAIDRTSRRNEPNPKRPSSKSQKPDPKS